MTTDAKALEDMSDEELDHHLAALYDEDRVVHADIEEAAKEHETRVARQTDAAVVAGLPSGVRDMLEKSGSLPEHVKDALVQAATASANGATTEEPA